MVRMVLMVKMVLMVSAVRRNGGQGYRNGETIAREIWYRTGILEPTNRTLEKGVDTNARGTIESHTTNGTRRIPSPHHIAPRARMKPRTPRSHAHDFLYRKIAEDLRAKLRTGAIAPGARLPSLNELAAEWGASRLTAMKAVEELRAAGLVVSVRAQGSFAAKREEPGAPTERTFTVGLLSRVLHPAGYGLYHQAMIGGLYDGLEVVTANLLVLAAGAAKPSDVPAMMRRAHADAMVYMGAFEPEILAEMLRDGPPAVVLDYDAGDLPVDGIRVDNPEIGRLAARHLLDRGVAPAELAILEGNPSDLSSRRRLEGALGAVRAAEDPQSAASR